MKKWVKYSLLFLFALFLLRGRLFRLLVSYHPIGERPTFGLTNKDLMQSIENHPVDTSIQSIIQRALDLTAVHLRFTSGKNDIDPNLLFSSKNAHCVGYAAFFNTTCLALLRKEKLENRFQVTHFRGKLTLLGFDLHQLTSSPFFGDHDFNVVEDLETGKKVYVDASLRDVLGIGLVSGD